MMSIHDPETYRSYTDRTPPIVKRHGGKFLTRGEDFTYVEGQDYDGRLVILEFPSKKAARTPRILTPGFDGTAGRHALR